MIVAVASRKASPGVTTLAALLGAYWDEPGTQRVVIEADPSGGTLAARWNQAHKLSWDPGLLALCASHGSIDVDSISHLTQEVAGGLRIAAAPPSPQQVGPALATLGERGARSLAAAESVRAFVDCGRLTASSPTIHLARRAAVILLMCRPNLEEIHSLIPGVAELREAGCSVALVCVGDSPYHPREIADKAEIPLLGIIPEDERGAEAFAISGVAGGRSFTRSPLARSMPDFVSAIQAHCAAEMVPHPQLTAENDDLLPQSTHLRDAGVVPTSRMATQVVAGARND